MKIFDSWKHDYFGVRAGVACGIAVTRQAVAAQHSQGWLLSTPLHCKLGLATHYQLDIIIIQDENRRL